MTETQPDIESMKSTDTDTLLKQIANWRAEAEHLRRCATAAEDIVRGRIGVIAHLPLPQDEKPQHPRDPWRETPPVSPWVQPEPFFPSPARPYPWTPPFIWY